MIEIIDEASRIEQFIPFVDSLLEKAGCGGLITLEKAEIIKYTAQK